MNNYKEISMEEAKKDIEGKENILILDVRTEEEYEEGHIANSVLIPLQELKENVGAKIADKGQVIYVYCRSGVRSKKASEILVELEYEKVYNIGGILDWKGELKK